MYTLVLYSSHRSYMNVNNNIIINIIPIILPGF